MTREDLSNLIALGEGFTTEFKQAGGSKLGREICAFANATGGAILIGVSDNGKIVGVNDHNRLKSEVQTIARTAEPPIAVDIEMVGDVLCVIVPEQHGKPYSFGGKFFIREGASSQQMSRDEIREFFFKEGLIHFDETICPDYDLETDLGPSVWKRFTERAKVPAGMASTTVLRNLHLIKDGRMVQAGAWLLCEDITRFSLRAGVTCALFQGRTKTRILDRKDFTADLYSIFEDCMAYMQSRLNTALIPHAQGRHELLELPEKALREAVVNAIVHRDYRSTANVQIYLFQDRLEIVTPGGLPAGMEKKDLGHKSVPRNPLLFALFYRMNLVEQIGSGIKRIRDECREYQISEPAIEVSDHWVSITFLRSNRKTLTGAEQEGTKMGPSRDQDGTKMGPRWDQDETKIELGRDQIETLRICKKSQPVVALMAALGRSNRSKFRKDILVPLIEKGLLEMTIPNKPRSGNQRYRTTPEGLAFLEGNRDIP
ncbi:MAG: ATP-binding protein [Desulfococcaceae bacterium]